MHLSKRLHAVAGMISEGCRVLDVGTDHAYLPIYLILQHKIPGALAMDVNKGPLKRAEDHIKEHHLEERIQVRLADGLSELHADEADALVIAGMGGNLIVRILTEGKACLSYIKEVILQPQSEVELVRRTLSQFGYRIVQEAMVEEDDKFYPVIKAVKGTDEQQSDLYYRYSICLLERKDQTLQRYLLKKADTLKKILEQLEAQDTEPIRIRREEIRKEQEEIEQILNSFYS